MEIEKSEQAFSRLSPLNVSKKHISTDYDEKNKNFVKNFSLPIIPENFTLESRLKSDRYMKSLPKYLQHYSQPSTNIFNDTDILRHVCDSLHVQSVLPTSMLSTSLKKVQDSFICAKSDENDIFADRIKNVLSETSISEYSEVPMKISSITASQQLNMIADKRPCRHELMEKEGNLKNASDELRSSDMDMYSIRNARTIPIKPILHMSSRKRTVKKKVRFPSQWPKVIALEHHRLFIDDLCSM